MRSQPQTCHSIVRKQNVNPVTHSAQGVTITAALCAKTELEAMIAIELSRHPTCHREASVQAQLLVRAARQACGLSWRMVAEQCDRRWALTVKPPSRSWQRCFSCRPATSTDSLIIQILRHAGHLHTAQQRVEGHDQERPRGEWHEVPQSRALAKQRW